MSTWKASMTSDIRVSNLRPTGGDDDWETDPDFVNDVTEEEQRWGSKTVEGSGHIAESVNIQELREQVAKDDAAYKKKVLEELPKASYGYGGKFGLQKDRMDKCAMGNDYIASVEKHTSQTDAVKGFGGKFGVQTDRQDKSAVGWEYHESLQKHASQKDYSSGFGGKYGVQRERQDKSAVGWEFHAKTEKHASQTDYAVGFGGKFGLQKDRQDPSAHGWDHVEKVEKHESQKDYAKGFGGKFGVQQDRKDKCAHGWEEVTKVEAHSSQVDMKKGFGGKFGIEEDKQDKSAFGFSETNLDKPQPTHEKPKPDTARAQSLRARFENLAKTGQEEAKKQAVEERKKREEKDRCDKEIAKRDEEQRQRKLCEEHKQLESAEQATTRDSLEGQQTREEEPHQEQPVRPGSRKDHSRVSVIPRELVVGPVKGGSTVTPPLVKEKDAAPQAMPVKEDSGQEEPKRIVPQIHRSPVESDSSPESVPSENQDEDIYEVLDPAAKEKISAVALYDYQAADYDEISFDPDDIITDIETIDEGWWRGKCHGRVGLFPANYVQPLF